MAVYFLEEIGADGKTVRVKIGYTDSDLGLQRIIEQVRGHAPGTIKSSLVLGAGTREDEKKLHRRFAKYRLKGTGGTEWFEPADEILKYIKDRQVGEAPKEKKKTPAMPKPDIRVANDVFAILQGFSPDKLKRLFREVLRYNSNDTSVETMNWHSDHARNFVAGNPTIVATYGKNDDFKVIHARLKNDRRIVPAEERSVSSQLLREYPYGLYVFSNASDSIWHFVNVRYEGQEDAAARKIFHSVPIEEGESVRTLSERLSILAVNYPEIRAPELQRICDFAFDVEEVTARFFQEYKRLYDKTKEALNELMKNDPKVKAEFENSDLTRIDDNTEETVIADILPQKILSQIVLLYFVQKKGWLGVERGRDWGTGPKDFLRRLFEKDYIGWSNFYNDALEVLFYDALARPNDYDFHSGLNCKVPFLNGGLFTPPYNWVDTDVLLPDDLFSNEEHTKEGYVGTGILDVFDRYNVTVKEDEPLEKEVGIDPEMLGKVFESLLESERKKKTGTFYTTREVVHYVCQETLALYLENELELPRTDIRAFLQHESTFEDALPDSVIEDADLVDEALRDVRILDPAVGSGAFPVGAMTEIVRLRNLLSPYVSDKGPRTLYDLKRHVIQENIYGADIEPVSAEVAKLRMWLSLIVDEEDPKKIKPLPNLDYKVICGDSLPSIERNVFNHKKFSELEGLEDLHFAETNRLKKNEYQREIAELADEITEGAIDIEVYFSKVFRDPAKGGFDIVLGNPPWGLKVNESLRQEYGLGNSDSYGVFIAKAIKRLLNPNGILGFIVHDTWLTIKSHRELRRIILDGSLRRVIQFNEDCFTGAAYVGKPGVFIWQERRDADNKVLVADLVNISTKQDVMKLKEMLGSLEDLVGQSTDEYAIFEYPQELVKTNSNLPIFLGSSKLFSIMNDVTSKKVWKDVGDKNVQVRQVILGRQLRELIRLGDIAKSYGGVKSYEGIYEEHLRTKDAGRYKQIDEALIRTRLSGKEQQEGIDDADNQCYVPMMKFGEHVAGRVVLNYGDFITFYLPWNKSFVKQLQSLNSLRNKDLYFGEGIFFSTTGQYAPCFRYAKYGLFDMNTRLIKFETPPNFFMMLGILCSTFMRYLLKTMVNHTAGTQTDDIDEILLPLLEKDDERIKTLVAQVIARQKTEPYYDYSEEQREIDKLVYQMYGLDEDDIAEVETWYRRRYPRLVKGEV